MKYARLFAMALTFMPLLAAAQFNGRSRIVTHVPFEFRAGDKLIPAGECIVESALPDGSALVIRNIHARMSLLSPAATKPLARPADHFALVFHKYGDRYFLSGVKVAGIRYMYRLPESGAEAELRAKAVPASEQILLAAQ
jgi:hypothetical protein